MIDSTLKYLKNQLKHPFYKFSIVISFIAIPYIFLNPDKTFLLISITVFSVIAIVSYIINLSKLSYISLCIITVNLSFLKYELTRIPDYINEDYCQIKAEIKKVNIRDSLRGNLVLDAIIDSKNYPLFKSEIICFYYGRTMNFNKGDLVYFEATIKKDKDYDKLSSFCFTNKIALKGESQVHDINGTYKNHVKFKIDSNYCENTQDLAYSVLSADKGNLTKQLKDDFSKTGIAHILTLSGLHISILFVISNYFFGIFLNEKFKLICIGIVLMGFLFLIDFPLSALRASIFAMIYYLLKFYQRYVLSVNILIVYVVLSILFDPKLINDISFQMSVSAVLGIILFNQSIIQLAMKIIPIRSGIIEFLVNALAVSISASIFLNIIVFYHFGNYSLLSPLLNMVIVPLFSLSLIYEVIALLGFSLFFTTSDMIYDIIIQINLFYIDKIEIYLPEINSIYLIISISIGVIYEIESKELKVFVFRVISSAIILYLTWLLFQ